MRWSKETRVTCEVGRDNYMQTCHENKEEWFFLRNYEQIDQSGNDALDKH